MQVIFLILLEMQLIKVIIKYDTPKTKYVEKNLKKLQYLNY